MQKHAANLNPRVPCARVAWLMAYLATTHTHHNAAMLQSRLACYIGRLKAKGAYLNMTGTKVDKTMFIHPKPE